MKMETFSEMLARQGKLKRINTSAQISLRTMSECIKNGQVKNLDLEIETFSNRYGIKVEDIKEFLEYLKTTVTKATVFYTEKTHELGYRVDDENLPAESRVIALITREVMVFPQGLKPLAASTLEVRTILQEAMMKAGWLKFDAIDLMEHGVLVP
jgi:hypothetical protein